MFVSLVASARRLCVAQELAINEIAPHARYEACRLDIDKVTGYKLTDPINYVSTGGIKPIQQIQ